jgi:hypothetical protein
MTRKHAHENTDFPEVNLGEAIQDVSMQSFLVEQNLVGGILAGTVAALVGAALWAGVTVVTDYQIGWMALGIGFLVGSAIRVVGKGITKVYGIIGATLSLIGCLLGNLFSICYFISISEEIGVMQVLSHLDISLVFRMLAGSFHPLDLLFYGLAIYMGYSQAFRRVEAGKGN